MTGSRTVREGRQAFAARSWARAYHHLVVARNHGEAAAEDLERLAVVAHLLGHDQESQAAFEAACRAHLDEGASPQAARCAFWLGLLLTMRGQTARGGGWLARAGRYLDGQPDGAEQGYLLLPPALAALHRGDGERALALFSEAAQIGSRFADPDLDALGRLGTGQALAALGRVREGLAALDDVMVSVEAEEVSPIPAGIIYCAVIEACQAVCDVDRARQWTAALSDWCNAQPELVPYRGQCLVHRAEILQLQGAWQEAREEASRAIRHLAEVPGDPAQGAAHYRAAELHRLRGDTERAERAYLEASRWGHSPLPGVALLRLAQGRAAAAQAALERQLAETPGPIRRAPLLAALVEVALARGRVADAHRAAEELGRIAGQLDAPMLAAMARQAEGMAQLGSGDAVAALGCLREAVQTWQELDAPYEVAQARRWLAAACLALGDADGAAMERELARDTFARLGAGPDLALIDRPPVAAARSTGTLSGREVEVLGLVAQGLTNREIARRLVISEHTVARHLQNIYAKVGVGSRTAAAAYAHEHGLVPLDGRS